MRKFIHNSLISIGEIFTEQVLVVKILFLLVLASPFIGLIFYLKSLFTKLGFDTTWNLGIIFVYSLLPLIMFGLLCFGLYKYGSKERMK